MNRGSAATLACNSLRALSFNEAPIHESGKCERVRVGARLLQLASMRPRFMNRGSHGLDLDADGPRLASMRPRFMNRGSVKPFA